MRGLVLSCALVLASPAAAYETADVSECNALWDGFIKLIPLIWGDDQKPSLIDAVTTDDGWCRLIGEAPGLVNAPFDTLDYRVDGINRFILDGIPPSALALRVRNVDTAGTDPRLITRVDVALAHDQASRSLLVETLELVEASGGRFQMTAVFNHLDLTNTGTMMMSVGGVSLSQAAGVLEVVGGDDLFEARREPSAARDMFLTALGTLPQETISPQSALALADFLDDAAPDGTLNFTVYSQRGIGLLQYIIGGLRHDTDTIAGFSEALEIALDGVTVTFDWEPVAAIPE